VDLGLGKRVVEKPIGFKRKDLNEALLKAVDILNRNASVAGFQQPATGTASSVRYNEDDFLEGLYRIEPTTGTQYEMYFKTKNLNKSTAQTSSQGQSSNVGTGSQVGKKDQSFSSRGEVIPSARIGKKIYPSIIEIKYVQIVWKKY
jgi:hypothetical protein